MKALFTSMFLVVLVVSVVGCATHRVSEVGTRSPGPVACSHCVVHAVYHYEPAGTIIVGSHDIPEGQKPELSELFSLNILRRNIEGIGPGMIVDIDKAGAIYICGMVPTYESIDFLNIQLVLEQDFRNHGPYWHRLIEPFLQQQ